MKKLYTRKEFETMRVECAAHMAKDKGLRRKSLGVLAAADRYNWLHQANWMGEPMLQLPQDMLALQEIIFNTRPEYIIEIGVAWGGSLLFYSTLMAILGGKRVIGVDIYIPDDLKKRLGSHGNVSKKITLINGSSIEPATVRKIESIVGKSKKTLVILDSNHTHAHVLKELEIYSSFVGKGYYLLCGDTIIEDIPEQKHRDRPWGPGNNPKTALREFLRKHKNFKVDRRIEDKLLFTCNPEGYLINSGK